MDDKDSLELKKLYDETIAKLKNNQRPQIKLTPELVALLKNEWMKALDHISTIQSSEALKKILCILDNTQNTTAELNKLFLRTLETITDPDLLVYTLSASQKHVINESLRTGNMIPSYFFDQLKILLKHKNPEVLEWTLRTIESMGPLSLRLMKDVRAVKLGLLSIFNQNLKSSSQIISLMELQWEKMQK